MSTLSSYFSNGHQYLIRSKTLRSGLIAFALVLAWGQTAFANPTEKESTAMAIAKFTTGVVAAYGLHEVGHWAGAKLTDTNIEFGAGKFNQPIGFTEDADNDTAGMIVHGSGLVSQLIVSEIILQSDSIDKNDSLVRGMMFWNVINPVIYALDYWWIRRTNQESRYGYQGDFEGFEHYSNEESADAFAATMSLLALYQGYRYAKTQTWAPDWIKDETVQLSFQPVRNYGKGGMLAVHFKF